MLQKTSHYCFAVLQREQEVDSEWGERKETFTGMSRTECSIAVFLIYDLSVSYRLEIYLLRCRSLRAFLPLS